MTEDRVPYGNQPIRDGELAKSDPEFARVANSLAAHLGTPIEVAAVLVEHHGQTYYSVTAALDDGRRFIAVFKKAWRYDDDAWPWDAAQ